MVERAVPLGKKDTEMGVGTSLSSQLLLFSMHGFHAYLMEGRSPCSREGERERELWPEAPGYSLFLFFATALVRQRKGEQRRARERLEAQPKASVKVFYILRLPFLSFRRSCSCQVRARVREIERGKERDRKRERREKAGVFQKVKTMGKENRQRREKRCEDFCAIFSYFDVFIEK